MPAAGPRRPILAVRETAKHIAYLERLAQIEGISLSEMVRRLLAEAVGARPRAEHLEPW